MVSPTMLMPVPAVRVFCLLPNSSYTHFAEGYCVSVLALERLVTLLLVTSQPLMSGTLTLATPLDTTDEPLT